MLWKSGIKKGQRGSTTEACSVPIDEVVMEKIMVLSVSKGSAGAVGVSGSITMDSAKLNAVLYSTSSSTSTMYPADDRHSSDISGTIASHTGTLTNSTHTDLAAKEYSAVLTNSTTLTCDGAYEWQVSEFY